MFFLWESHAENILYAFKILPFDLFNAAQYNSSFSTAIYKNIQITDTVKQNG